MAAPTIRCLALTVLTIIVLWDINIREVYARECQAIDTASFLTRCVQGNGRPRYVEPSGFCCQAVNELTVPCICKGISKDIEKIYNMDDFVYVVQYCGGPLESGTQCGSYKVPPLGSRENASRVYAIKNELCRC